MILVSYASLMSFVCQRCSTDIQEDIFLFFSYENNCLDFQEHNRLDDVQKATEFISVKVT